MKSRKIRQFTYRRIAPHREGVSRVCGDRYRTIRQVDRRDRRHLGDFLDNGGRDCCAGEVEFLRSDHIFHAGKVGDGAQESVGRVCVIERDVQFKFVRVQYTVGRIRYGFAGIRSNVTEPYVKVRIGNVRAVLYNPRKNEFAERGVHRPYGSGNARFEIRKQDERRCCRAGFCPDRS